MKIDSQANCFLIEWFLFSAKSENTLGKFIGALSNEIDNIEYFELLASILQNA